MSKRHGRVLRFAVSGALLGAGVAGCEDPPVINEPAPLVNEPEPQRPEVVDDEPEPIVDNVNEPEPTELEAVEEDLTLRLGPSNESVNTTAPVQERRVNTRAPLPPESGRVPQQPDPSAEPE